ncbi:MAG: SMI1/KNR4 family protein [Gemmataceae bacterium]|nr:SMI1/KNR4 family protein [Gemmataceae bacterium]
MSPTLEHTLTQEFSTWQGSVATPVSPPEVQQAEAALAVTFPDDYRRFIERFGGAVVRGTSIFGLRQPDLMPDEPSSVVDQSLAFRQELPAPLANMVVISVDDAGNPIGFLPPQPSVITFDHNFGGRYDLAPTFEEYLRHLLASPS